MRILEVHVTCPDRSGAEQMGAALVGARLAACANVSGPVRSSYWWEGEIQRDDEHLLVLKTRADLFDAVAARIAELHPYEVPSVLGYLVDLAIEDYRDWVYESTVDSPN